MVLMFVMRHCSGRSIPEVEVNLVVVILFLLVVLRLAVVSSIVVLMCPAIVGMLVLGLSR